MIISRQHRNILKKFSFLRKDIRETGLHLLGRGSHPILVLGHHVDVDIGVGHEQRGVVRADDVDLRVSHEYLPPR